MKSDVWRLGELMRVFRGSDGEYWEGCNGEYYRRVFGCRFGGLPLRVSCGVNFFFLSGYCVPSK